MFSDLTVGQKELAYQALKKMVESCGIGFCNGNRRHPVYLVGATGEEWHIDASCPDGPEQNDLYQMLSALSTEFKEGNQVNYTWFYDFSEWQDFCKFAINPLKQD